MKWVSVQNGFPQHGETVLVKIGHNFAVAQFSKYDGFSADDSGYEIHCDDDSGLYVTLADEVQYWASIDGVFLRHGLFLTDKGDKK